MIYYEKNNQNNGFIFLNEDRHTHNITVLMNGKGDYAYCPIFNNGVGLLADTTMDYTKNDVTELLEKAEEYPEEIRNRVEMIIFAQMRKYTYLFS